MKNQLISILFFLSFSGLSQEIIKEPKYKILLPQPMNIDSFYCKISKCFYPLSPELFIDSLDNKEVYHQISIDFIVTEKGGVLNFQPNFPYPIEFFTPFKRMSRILFDDGQFIPARFRKNKKSISMKVRLFLSIHKNGIESFSINSYDNGKQFDYYDMKRRYCH